MNGNLKKYVYETKINKLKTKVIETFFSSPEKSAF